MLRIVLSSSSALLVLMLTGELFLTEAVSTGICVHRGLLDSLELGHVYTRQISNRTFVCGGRFDLKKKTPLPKSDWVTTEKPDVESFAKRETIWRHVRDIMEKTAMRAYGSLPLKWTSPSVRALKPETPSVRLPSNVLDVTHPRQKRHQDRGNDDQNVAFTTSPLNPLSQRLPWILSAVTAPIAFLVFFFAFKSHLINNRRISRLRRNRRPVIPSISSHDGRNVRWVDRGVQSGSSHLFGHMSQRLIDEDEDECSSDGLTEYEIAAVPIESYTSCPSMQRTPNESCSVCLERLNDGECVKQLPPCKHSFHPECIDLWLRRSATCPLCRRYVSERRTALKETAIQRISQASQTT